MKKIYKQVIIFGPDEEEALMGVIDMAPRGNNCLIIGDGKRSISLEEIERKLTGRINEATRIDICAHGGIYEKDLTGSHCIWLSSSPIYTESLFRTFKKVSRNEPIYTHLWSCYANNADKEFSFLPERSMAVFHSSKNTFMNLTHKTFLLDYHQYDGSITGAEKNLSDNLEKILLIGGTIKLNRSKKEYAVRYVIPEVVNSNKWYLDFIYEYFHQKGVEYHVQATENVEQDLIILNDNISKILNLDINSKNSLESLTKDTQRYRDHFIMRVLVENKDHYRLKQFLENSTADPNSENENMHSPIFYVADKKTAELLIKYGADVNHQSINDISLLEVAIARKLPIEIIETLLENGADPNLKDDLGETPIFHAESKDAVEILVKYGADVNHNRKDGLTLLEFAIDEGRQVEVIEALLENGAITDYAIIDLPAKEKVEDIIDKKEDPMQYLIKCHQNDNIYLLSMISIIEQNNHSLYNKIGSSKIKSYLDKELIVKGRMISNFRKIIKSGDIECLDYALNFNPVVTLSDIEMAKRIFANDLHDNILQKMEKNLLRYSPKDKQYITILFDSLKVDKIPDQANHISNKNSSVLGRA